jgi:hypothetical protein
MRINGSWTAWAKALNSISRLARPDWENRESKNTKDPVMSANDPTNPVTARTMTKMSMRFAGAVTPAAARIGSTAVRPRRTVARATATVPAQIVANSNRAPGQFGGLLILARKKSVGARKSFTATSWK